MWTEEEEEFYKLRPANKADHFLQGSQTLHSVKQLIPIMFVYDYKSSYEKCIIESSAVHPNHAINAGKNLHMCCACPKSHNHLVKYLRASHMDTCNRHVQ
ncbi:hypothetical protein ABBQ32_000462 [Trebouxia sp. C0010 RCD-2024]